MSTETKTANATASLVAQGSTTATGSITWTAPQTPARGTITSIRISGMWEWTGKGNVTRVTINGVNTSGAIAFDIDITGKTSPLSITCVGNKNATGSSFRWSNLITTYTYEVRDEQMMIKIGGNWQNVPKVYKKVNGTWVEQTDLSSLFDINTKYQKMN